MTKGKRVVSLVLALVVLSGLFGCTDGSIVSAKLNEPIALSEESFTTEISKITLSQSMQGMYIEDVCFFEDSFLGVILFDPKQKSNFENLDNIDYLFAVFSIEDRHLLYQETITIPKAGYVSFQTKGDTTILNSSYPGNKIYYSISSTGIMKMSEEQYHEFYLSDSASVIENNNNLVLSQNGETRIILTGVLPNNNGISEETYRFFARLSDSRFIYAKLSYSKDSGKWLSEYGVYDVETGEKAIFSHDHADFIWAYTSYKDEAILIPDQTAAYSSFGPYLYDDSTRELTDLNWLDFSFGKEVHPRFCLFENILVVYMGDEDSSVLRFFDLKTKTEIKKMDIPAPYNVSEVYLTNIYTTEGNLWFCSCLHSDSYLYRISLEEAMN